MSKPVSNSCVRSGPRLFAASRARIWERRQPADVVGHELAELLPVQRLVAGLAERGAQLHVVDEGDALLDAVRRRRLGIEIQFGRVGVVTALVGAPAQRHQEVLVERLELLLHEHTLVDDVLSKLLDRRLCAFVDVLLDQDSARGPTCGSC